MSDHRMLSAVDLFYHNLLVVNAECTCTQEVQYSLCVRVSVSVSVKTFLTPVLS